jgi:hypothetical protein
VIKIPWRDTKRVPSYILERTTSLADINFQVAWIAILCGLVSGTFFGLFFHRAEWLGGYASWRRRLIRLGHISFFGTAALNLAFTFSVQHLRLVQPPRVASLAFVAGAVTMPLVCFLSAWRESFRHLFFIPVGSLIVASASFVLQWILL